MVQDKDDVESPLWIFPKEDLKWRDQIVKEFNIHPVTAQVLISRGFDSLESIHRYLYAKLPDLHDPYLMNEMDAAVQRVCRALQDGENILIYGDNDVDGMTGTALLTDFLRYLGGKVYYYVSSRSILRQSLIVEALEYALSNQCKLLITVDCGVTATNEIAKVVEKNVDVIVTDHHEPTDRLPHCVATLNPKLFNSQYPNRDLTGVGVAFKLAHAITDRLVREGKITSRKVDLKRYLDLVALGTIADMGQLRGENRILVHYGIRQLRRNKRVGLAKLCSIGDVNVGSISTFTIASKISPRLNSLGRIADPNLGVKMLLLRSAAAGEKLARELDLNNIERQKIERTMSSEASEILQKHPEILEKKAIILYSDTWHPGVIPILSARIARQFNRPTILIAIENDVGKGSLRSIHEFPLIPVLKNLSDCLISFGGHDFAAGLVIHAKDIPEFAKRFVALAEEKLKDGDIRSKLRIDASINFDELTFDFMDSIRLLEPYGNENPQPVLYTKVKQAWPPRVMGNHLKLYLEQGDRMLEGIAYGRAADSRRLRHKNLELQIAFSPQINDFGPNIQLLIRDFCILQPEKV